VINKLKSIADSMLGSEHEEVIVVRKSFYGLKSLGAVFRAY